MVILGYNAAKKVFQGAPGAGQHVEIGGLDFEVTTINPVELKQVEEEEEYADEDEEETEDGDYS